MLERLRQFEKTPNLSPKNLPSKPTRAREFGFNPHNYEKVDLVASMEVVIDRVAENKERNLYAQIDFVERLYVEGKRAKIEFGVQRAFLAIENKGLGCLSPAEDFSRENVYYLTLHEPKAAISVCMDPANGRSTLGALALPPAPDQNRYSRVATATPDVDANALTAELILSLSSEGLYFFENDEAKPSQTLQRKIEAIMKVAVAKEKALEGKDETQCGEIRRPVQVKER